ncbi:uncharacterized protein PAC_06664 [Phialocephala subalpina]|uniref:2EXR domain-containing protein n=1 Tax=Phialocephala subalpina TaxID=576137 RepID=A0A1L7WVI7_9HELO|nr:uncharacterized protein PAC_06664 [Phialocephala subalpina]
MPSVSLNKMTFAPMIQLKMRWSSFANTWLVLKREDAARYYEEKLCRLKEEYEDLHDQITIEYRSHILRTFSYADRVCDPFSIADRPQDHGIAEIRKRIVPAYTFDKFRELPTELQLRIWSFASRSTEPRITHLHRMEGEDTNLDFHRGWRFQYDHLVNESIGVENDSLWYDDHHVPEVLHICHDSRTAALQVYTRFCMKYYKIYEGYNDLPREVYINMLYDSAILNPISSFLARVVFWECNHSTWMVFSFQLFELFRRNVMCHSVLCLCILGASCSRSDSASGSSGTGSHMTS